LTADDHASLAKLGLNWSFDFRGNSERAATPYQLPGVVQHSLAIEPTVVQRMEAMEAAGRELTEAIVVELMNDLYRSLVNDQASRFAQFFEHLLRAEGPLVFHCTAGKDRTGVAAALVLLALGVSRDQIMQDYLLTNELLERPMHFGSQVPSDTLAVLWRVQKSYLDTALQTIDADHGGVDSYLRHLGLTRAELGTLADKYLES
jgi:protein-tyrosine phosphatase